MSFVRGPLPIAIALALGIALAPLPRSAAWVLALACMVVAARLWHARRRVALLLVAVAVAAVGAARGAPTPLRIPAGTTIDDRGLDRIEGVVDGLVVKTAHGYGARIGVTWVWTEEPLKPGERVA